MHTSTSRNINNLYNYQPKVLSKVIMQIFNETLPTLKRKPQKFAPSPWWYFSTFLYKTGNLLYILSHFTNSAANTNCHKIDISRLDPTFGWKFDHLAPKGSKAEHSIGQIFLHLNADFSPHLALIANFITFCHTSLWVSVTNLKIKGTGFFHACSHASMKSEKKRIR
jgi:hypothetical protein